MQQIDLKIFDAEGLQSALDGYAPADQISDLDLYEVDFDDRLKGAGFGFGPKNYWKALKVELRLLTCGGDDPEKYAALRNVLCTQSGISQTAVVSTIAVFVGAEIGVQAGLIVPFVALFLIVAARVGYEAFCRAMNMDQHD